VDWIDLSHDRDRWGGGCCNRGNEPSGSIKCGEFIDYLRTGYLPKKDSAAWSK
jgi:hypothetical protein